MAPTRRVRWVPTRSVFASYLQPRTPPLKHRVRQRLGTYSKSPLGIRDSSRDPGGPQKLVCRRGLRGCRVWARPLILPLMMRWWLRATISLRSTSRTLDATAVVGCAFLRAQRGRLSALWRRFGAHGLRVTAVGDPRDVRQAAAVGLCLPVVSRARRYRCWALSIAGLQTSVLPLATVHSSD